jgi:hypothetical protein
MQVDQLKVWEVSLRHCSFRFSKCSASLSQSLHPMIISVAELCIFVAMHEFPGRLVQIYFYQCPLSRGLDRCWLSRPFHSVPSARKCGMAGTHHTVYRG